MHELQQLHGELDVAQPTRAQLDLAGPHPRGHEFLDAPAHCLHLGHEVLTLAGRPHHRHQRLDVLHAEFGVACGGSRLHQRLEFPRLGPPLVIRDVRVQRAYQLALLAFGSQRRIHLEEGVAGEPHHLAGHSGRERVGIVGDEDDVDVADVVQLARATLAHRDHRDPWALTVVPTDRPGRDGQRGAQRSVGQIGQMLTDR